MFSPRATTANWKRTVIALLVSGAVFLLLDQWSKRLITLRAPLRPLPAIPGVRMRLVVNARSHYTRAAVRTAFALAWAAALVSAILLQNAGQAFQNRAALIGVGAALGGAAGNLADILRSGSITDFIDLGWWPVFNLADVAIIAGLTAAFWPR